MPDAIEASLPAPVVGYDGKQAVRDLLGGAVFARLPVRRRAGAAIGFGWLVLLLLLAGLADGLDVYLRSPFKPSEVPADVRPNLWLVNLIGLPLTCIAAVVVSALLFIASAGVLLGRRAEIAHIATAIVLGFWAAVLPVLLAAGVGGGIGLAPDIVAIIVCCIILGYVAPSLSEAADISTGRAVGVLIIGAIMLVIGAGAVMFAFGLSAKIFGYHP